MRHPLRGGIMHRAGARIRLAGKSLKTLRRSIFFTRPLMAHQRNALLESRAFFLCPALRKQHLVRHRGRKQHVRPVSVPAGSNSPADCWKVRGSRWSPDGGMGAVRHPLRGGIMHRANARIRLAGKSLNTLRRSVFFTRPLAHQKKPYGNVRLFLFYGLFGCIRPEPQDAPAAPVRNGDKNRSRCWSPGGR